MPPGRAPGAPRAGAGHTTAVAVAKATPASANLLRHDDRTLMQ